MLRDRADRRTAIAQLPADYPAISDAADLLTDTTSHLACEERDSLRR